MPVIRVATDDHQSPTESLDAAIAGLERKGSRIVQVIPSGAGWIIVHEAATKKETRVKAPRETR